MKEIGTGSHKRVPKFERTKEQWKKGFRSYTWKF